MKVNRVLLFATVIFMASACKNDESGYDQLNALAAKEYLEPIRPGNEAGNLWWNIHSKKFIYAPVFGFERIPGAVRYRYTATQPEDSTSRKWTFIAGSPNEALSKMWNKIPPGKTKLKVEGLNEAGDVVGIAGERNFVRDFPFHGPYHGPARDYHEAAVRAAVFIHEMSCTKYWLDHDSPNLSIPQNTYTSPEISALAAVECFVAKMRPDLAGEALIIARKAGDFVLKTSGAPGGPFPNFPASYGEAPGERDPDAAYVRKVQAELKGTTMTYNGSLALIAWVNLWEQTGEQRWFDAATTLMDTYSKFQREDGSWPSRFNLETGEVLNPAGSNSAQFLFVSRMLSDKFPMHKWKDMIDRNETWLKGWVESTFDMTQQFNDTRRHTIDRYSNLTGLFPSYISRYILQQDALSEKDLTMVRDLVRVGEDQFAHWNSFPDAFGFQSEPTPCVHEQYGYEVPVDDSSASLAMAFLALWKRTGEELAFAKAKALMDKMTLIQNSVTGQIPTIWKHETSTMRLLTGFWINCNFWDIVALEEMAEADAEYKRLH